MKTHKRFPDYNKDIVVVSVENQTIHWTCLICGECWTTQIDQSKQYQNIVKCPNAEHHNLGYTLDELHKLKLNRKLHEVSELLYREYDIERNHKNVNNVTIGDTTKRIWQCRVCGNHWKAAPIERFNAKENKIMQSCLKCSQRENKQNKQIVLRNTERNKFGLAYQRPKFISYFDKELNNIDLFKISNKQSCKVHWRCYRCGYKWVKPPVQNFPKNICPACQTRLVQGLNDLETVQKSNLKHFDYKNNSKKPIEIHYLSKAKLHWKCADCGHTQMVSPLDLYNNRRICINCDTVGNRYKDILKYVSNQDNTDKVSSCRVDSRMLVDWKCGDGHIYSMTIRDRISRFYGCPHCRYRSWAYTKIKKEFNKRDISVKEILDIPEQSQQALTQSILVGNTLICVVQLYSCRDKDTENIAKYAVEKGYTYYEVIEEPMGIIQDIQKIQETFRIPMSNQDIHLEQLVEWFIRYGEIKVNPKVGVDKSVRC